MVTQYFINLFVLYAVLIYIIYIELVEFCDAFNIKGVKCFFFVILETTKLRPALN